MEPGRGAFRLAINGRMEFAPSYCTGVPKGVRGPIRVTGAALTKIPSWARRKSMTYRPKHPPMLPLGDNAMTAAEYRIVPVFSCQSFR